MMILMMIRSDNEWYTALLYVSCVCVCVFVAGGYLNTHLAQPFRWLRYVSIFSYSLSALSIIEFQMGSPFTSAIIYVSIVSVYGETFCNHSDLSPSLEALRDALYKSTTTNTTFKVFTLVHQTLSGYAPRYIHVWRLLRAASSSSPTQEDCARLTFFVRFSSVGRAPTSATETSVQLDLESATICRRTSDSRTCHTAVSDSRKIHF